MPVTMVEVRMFMDSSSVSGLETLKNSWPLWSKSSNLFPFLRSSTWVQASSFTTLEPSRLT